MTVPAARPATQIHLDFHTGSSIPDVGRDFDARNFADTFVRANVRLVTLFAKCHHGHLYYDTDRPERHPGLPRRLDLLGEQIKALKAVGIRTPIYLSVQCDEYAANAHPEWVARSPDGKPVKAGGVFDPGWQILDMNSPYQDFLIEQTAEVIRKFSPIDGLFFDMCWDQPSVSTYAITAMKAVGLDPQSEADRRRHARTVTHGYMRRLHDMAVADNPDASVYFNSRPLTNVVDEKQWQTHVEIEALPNGGWGYMYFPKNVRFVRTVCEHVVGQTARFHKGWADFGGIKPYAALEYETSQMLAHGALVNVGDQLHPRGVLDPAAYANIGRAFARVVERDPWTAGARPLTEIGVVITAGHALGVLESVSKTDEGATRMLMQLKHQFDLLDPAADFAPYRVIVLADVVPVTPELAARLARYVEAGGAVLASGLSGLNSDATRVLLPELGIRPDGSSAFGTSYVRFADASVTGLPSTDHVMYDRALNVRPAEGATSLADVVDPYFERTWDHFSSHYQTPPDRPTGLSATTLNGRCGYVAYPVFRSYAEHANLACRWLVRDLLDRLLPDPLVRSDAPANAEITMLRQDERTIVHVLHYTPERRTKMLDVIEDVVPLHDVRLSVRLDRRPTAVYLAPGREPLAMTRIGGRAEVTVPVVNGHAMIVFE